MLTITKDAATVLTQNRETAGAPDSFGVRFFAATPPGGGEPAVAIAFVPEAEPGDDVTEQEGVTAYLAPEVSDALDEATLDASPGNGGTELILNRP
jgi:Fe-S cluster assembly iron-binding protein IscA